MEYKISRTLTSLPTIHAIKLGYILIEWNGDSIMK